MVKHQSYIRIHVAKNAQSIGHSGNRYTKIALTVTVYPATATATGSVHLHLGVVESTPLRLEGEERDSQAREEDYKLEEEDRRRLLAAVDQGDRDERAEDAADPAHRARDANARGSHCSRVNLSNRPKPNNK